jgi:hypothetical protein
MATLNFFNPATLLPSPEVAVKPPPQNTGGSFLISEALKETTQLVKAKRDVDSLKAEANAYADYVQDQSPELANLLRNKSSQYRIGMDTNEERSGFLKGVIGLSRLEQQDRKLELTAQKNDKFNNTGTKLNNLRGLLEIQSRRALEWDQEESRLEKEQDANIQRIAGLGLNSPLPPKYVKKPNPYTAKVDSLSAELEATISDTDSYPSKGEPALPSGFTPVKGVGGGLFPGDPEAVTPATPGTDVGQDAATVNNLPVTEGQPINPLVGGPPPPPEGTYTLPNPSAGAEPPRAEIVPESSAPQSTEKPATSREFKIDPTGETQPVEVTPGVIPPSTATPNTTVPAAVSPVDVNDKNYLIQQQAIAAREAIKQSAIEDVKSAFDNVDSQKEALNDKSQLDRLSNLRDQAEKDIAAVSRSNPDLKILVKAIAQRYKTSVNQVMMLSVNQLNAEKLKLGDQVVTYETAGTAGGASGPTINLIERQVVDNKSKTSQIRIYKVNPDRTEIDVTDEVNKKMLKRIGPVIDQGVTPSVAPSSPTSAVQHRPLSDLFKQ